MWGRTGEYYRRSRPLPSGIGSAVAGCIGAPSDGRAATLTHLLLVLYVIFITEHFNRPITNRCERFNYPHADEVSKTLSKILARVRYVQYRYTGTKKCIIYRTGVVVDIL